MRRPSVLAVICVVLAAVSTGLLAGCDGGPTPGSEAAVARQKANDTVIRQFEALPGAAFSRASVALGAQASGVSGAEATPVTVKTRWTATWEGNGVGPSPIAIRTDPQDTLPIRVNEVQTLVTGTG